MKEADGGVTACIKEYGGIIPNHETDDPLAESPLAAGSY